jgi:hypothetical protein
MNAPRAAFLAGLLAALLPAAPAAAQDATPTQPPDWEGVIEPVSGFTGQMSMTMETEPPAGMAVEEVIRFEPWQMLDDLFRDDIVFLMRTGPTDWDAAENAVAGAQDCDAQRRLTEAGRDAMRQFGALLIVNDLRPGEIVLSEWCRAQETYLGLETGMLQADMAALDGLGARMEPGLNPLGADTAPGDVDALRDLVTGWEGSEDGPLLVLTHFDNIRALTRFDTYEGEILLLDPTRDGRVLGYLRLGSATPDLVRFPEDVVDYARSVAAARED